MAPRRRRGTRCVHYLTPFYCGYLLSAFLAPWRNNALWRYGGAIFFRPSPSVLLLSSSSGISQEAPFYAADNVRAGLAYLLDPRSATREGPQISSAYSASIHSAVSIFCADAGSPFSRATAHDLSSAAILLGVKASTTLCLCRPLRLHHHYHPAVSSLPSLPPSAGGYVFSSPLWRGNSNKRLGAGSDDTYEQTWDGGQQTSQHLVKPALLEGSPVSSSGILRRVRWRWFGVGATSDGLMNRCRGHLVAARRRVAAGDAPRGAIAPANIWLPPHLPSPCWLVLFSLPASLCCAGKLALLWCGRSCLFWPSALRCFFSTG